MPNHESPGLAKYRYCTHSGLLENYTFLTSECLMQRTNVYASTKEEIFKGFSNMPETCKPTAKEHPAWQDLRADANFQHHEADSVLARPD